jgi:hypothetical protein
MIERSVVPLVKRSTASDPLPSSVPGVLLGAAIVKGEAPSGGPTSRPRSWDAGYAKRWQQWLGNDCSGTLGGDGFMNRYCGGDVTILDPLLRGR